MPITTVKRISDCVERVLWIARKISDNRARFQLPNLGGMTAELDALGEALAALDAAKREAKEKDE